MPSRHACNALSLTAAPPAVPGDCCSGRGALYRQTVLLSSFASAEMNALLARSCRNHGGKARLWPTHKGVLSQIIPQARQVFERLPAALAAGGAPAAGGSPWHHWQQAFALRANRIMPTVLLCSGLLCSALA